MASPITDEIRIVSVNGMLGYGYELESLKAGIAAQPHLIGCDAGSTDPGLTISAAELAGCAATRFPRSEAGAGRRCPQQHSVRHRIGGLCRRAANVELTLEILRAHLQGRGPPFQARRNPLGRRQAWGGACPRRRRNRADAGRAGADARFDRRKQSYRGPDWNGAYIAAFEQGAQVVIAGVHATPQFTQRCRSRAGSTRPCAAHVEKIMECGAQCAIPLAPNDCLLGTIRRDHFLVRPLAKHRICTPESVAAHTMYEQSNPFRLRAGGCCRHPWRRFRAGGPAKRARVRFELRPLAGFEDQARRRAPHRRAGVHDCGARDRQVIENLEVIERAVGDAGQPATSTTRRSGQATSSISATTEKMECSASSNRPASRPPRSAS